LTAYAANEFNDVEDHWAKFYIMDATAKMYISGYPDGSFNPNDLITLSDAFILVPRLVAKKYQNWFFANTIKSPEEGRKFFMDNKIITAEEFPNINKPITREELAYLLIKSAKLMPSSVPSNFTDYNLISMDKRGYVNRINYVGVLNGSNGKFNPLSPITRAEFCVVISRMAQLKVPEDKIQATAYVKPVNDMPVPILLYHSITFSEEEALNDPMFVTPEKLRRDLELINSLGYTPIFAKDLDKELPPKPIVITFDDGYLTNYELAFPILKETGMKMTIFLNGYTGEISGFEHKFTWNQAREMIDSSVIDIQTHTAFLHYINDDGIPLTFQQYGEDSKTHAERLETDCVIHNDNFKLQLGYEPTIFAYPYGLANEATEAVLKKFYISTLTTEAVVSNPAYGLYLLPRITITETTELDFLVE